MVIAAYDNSVLSRFIQCNKYFRVILESELQNQTRNVCFELQKEYGNYLKVEKSWFAETEVKTDGNIVLKKVVKVKLINSWYTYMNIGKSLILKSVQQSYNAPNLITSY